MSARHAHAMPFGAEIAPEGVRFRLWAPAQRHVALVLEAGGAEANYPMAEVGDGWFELTTDRAKAGSRYRFQLDEGMRVPDPASRWQPDDVHGASEVVEPRHFAWHHADWRGRPWEETVLYELHLGCFTSQGGFDGARRRLDHLAELGVTAVELMPVADCEGRRGWGYDGVLPFAPESGYGRPASLKRLVDEAHARGLIVFLDVVYNHFGPSGNYLHLYAPDFFTDRHHTPWGAAINFDGPGAAVVREFFIHNALYWLNEYRFDGLRLDAVHAILDDSEPHFLLDLAARVRDAVEPDRHVHLVLENDDNAARFLRCEIDGQPAHFVAQWNDDLHHAAHVIATHEATGYYADYIDAPLPRLVRGLAEGFIYQGEPSAHRGGHARGEPSGDLPPTAFVDFLQNHDQVGNRAFGERLLTLAEEAAVAALSTILLLSPHIPMLFMGEEWGERRPFLYFCDFTGDLAQAVREGRRREFARFEAFSDEATRDRIPDPGDEATFSASKLDWRARSRPHGRRWLDHTRQLLALRHAEVVPRLGGAGSGSLSWHEGDAFRLTWTLGDGSTLHLLANLSPHRTDAAEEPPGRLLARQPSDWTGHGLPPWSVCWTLQA